MPMAERRTVSTGAPGHWGFGGNSSGAGRENETRVGDEGLGPAL